MLKNIGMGVSERTLRIKEVKKRIGSRYTDLHRWIWKEKLGKEW